MKRFVLLLLLVAPLISLAQNNGLSGNWQEIKRTGQDGAATHFSDTIRLGFLTGNEYTWVKNGGFIYRGSYKVENGALDMGARYFTIVSHAPDRLVLRDRESTYEFAPYTPPVSITLAKDPPPLPVTHISRMAGNWKVYKRTSARTQQNIDYYTLVESVRVFDTPDADGTLGWVAAAKDPDGTHSWKITKFANSHLYTSGKSDRIFEVLKAEDELILKEGDITYFFKQFD
jgi:hypothetical protein